MIELNRFFFIYINKNKRLTICLRIIERLKTNDIFIFNDELYHEVKKKNKHKISIIKNDDFYKFAIIQFSMQFSIMQ